jgi:glycosyltransferase involved in cell wall biosynthesis
MKIIYFTRDYSPHDARFLSALAGTTHQVLLMRLEGSPGEKRTLPKGIREVEWQGGKQSARWHDYPSLRRDLKRVIHEEKPNLIHAGPIQRVAILPALSGYQPLVSMSWGSDLLHDAQKSTWSRWIARYVLTHTSILVGDCQAVKDKATELGFPMEKVVLFPWGVDLKHFSPGKANELREKLGWNKNLILLSNRSWEPIYGVDLVVRAFAEAIHKNPDFRLLLLGDGSQKADILKLISTLGLKGKVFLGGRISQQDLPEYYHAADLFLSASHSDGSSVSLLEAMACGKTMVVSDIAGNKEWVIEQENGWLFSDGDQYELARKIIEAANNENRRVEYGKKNRLLAEKKADWKQNFQKLLMAYKQAINTKQKLKDGTT